MNPIYKGIKPPKNHDVLWLKDEKIYIYKNNGWEEASPEIDSTMIPNSTNPVQSQVIQAAIAETEQSLQQEINQKQDILTFDSALSETSTNPIQNKAVYKQYINEEEVDDIILEIDPSRTREIYSKRYVTLTLKSVGNLYRPTYSGTNAKLYYSVDDGNTWTLFNSTVNNIPSGTKVLLKGENITKFTSRLYTDDTEFDLSGNILSLFYGDNFRSATNLPGSYACENLFSQTKIKDASNLILPEAAVPEYGYHATFKWCSTMTQAPILPATTVGDRGYYEMFSMCSVLTTAPVIEATSLGKYTCLSMFYHCTHLVNAPVLKATFETGATYNYEGVYSNMFEGCSALVKAPDLISTVIPQYGYYNMFKNCSSLNYVKCLATNNTWSAATSYWLNGVAQSGTFVQKTDVTWTSGISGIPSGWTVVNV